MKREPKSIHNTEIAVVGRDGRKKGRISLSSGNLQYSRSAAKAATLTLTYQRLVEILEREIEYAAIDPSNAKWPSHASGDFTLEANELEIDGGASPIVFSTSVLKNLDGRRVDEGYFQFTPDMAKGRQTKKYDWVVRVSVHAALWIVHRYIEKFLVGRKFTNATSRDVVVSKRDMYRILSSMQKRVSP